MNPYIEANSKIWGDYFSNQSKGLSYPDEGLVRIFSSSDLQYASPPANLLDHGFGSANNSIYFARSGYTVYGAEVCQGAIDRAILRFETDGLSGQFDLIKDIVLPYKPETFDIIVSWNCIHYNGTYENVRAICSDLFRILKPGGALFLSTITTNHNLCLNAIDLGGGHFQVNSKYKHDARGGLKLFVPLSQDHFMGLFDGYNQTKYGWIDFNTFNPEKRLSCHLFYGIKY